MPHNSTGPGKKTTVFLSLRLPLVSGHFVSILRAKNTGRKRTSRDHGCSPVLLPCRSGRMSEIDADQCHFVMPFTECRTTHAKNLCPLDPSSIGFSTPALIGRHEHEAAGGVEEGWARRSNIAMSATCRRTARSRTHAWPARRLGLGLRRPRETLNNFDQLLVHSAPWVAKLIDRMF